eukprot:scaffold222247_cov39-Tisochrysis_lutea.AAC.1
MAHPILSEVLLVLTLHPTFAVSAAAWAWDSRAARRQDSYVRSVWHMWLPVGCQLPLFVLERRPHLRLCAMRTMARPWRTMHHDHVVFNYLAS